MGKVFGIRSISADTRCGCICIDPLGESIPEVMLMFWKKKVQKRVITDSGRGGASLTEGLARVNFSEILESRPSVGRYCGIHASVAVNKIDMLGSISKSFIDNTQCDSNHSSSSKSVSIAAVVDKGIDALREGNFKYAGDCFQKVVFSDLDHAYAQVMLKMADYWVEKVRRYEFLPADEKSDFLMTGWRTFSELILSKMEFIPDRALFAIRGWLFGEVASNVTRQLDQNYVLDSAGELYLTLGRAYKMRGDYDLAIDAYLEGVALNKQDSRLLAELADCYAIIDEEVSARLFFREAFFHGAMTIDFDSLESAMILGLRKRVKEVRPGSNYSSEWLGVYGILWGVFSLGRELSPSEFAKLNQSIHMLRSEIDDIPVKKEILVPRLIYRLFWLIDYYKHLGAESDVCKKQIRSALLDIRFLDERISKDYRL